MKNIVQSVSIIIPAYQENEAIGDVVTSVSNVACNLGCEYEVIVVDDGSTDCTGDTARRLGANVITHPFNKGYGASLKTGIRYASHQTVIFLDADGQHDPSDIQRLLAERKNFDMVVGARKGMAGSPMWRKPGKFVLKLLVNSLTGHKIPDFNSGYRALDREMALRFLPIMPNGFSFSTTSTIAAFKGGYLVKYIPIQVSKRIGKSMLTAADGFITIMLIIRLVTLFSPLRVFLPISGVTFLVGLIFTGYGYVNFGEASLKGMIALIAAVQFFLFGVMVDQLAAVRRGENIGQK